MRRQFVIEIYRAMFWMGFGFGLVVVVVYLRGLLR